MGEFALQCFSLYVVECELYFPLVFGTSSESSSAGAIAGAVAAVGCVTIISVGIIIIVIIIRDPRTQHKEER